MSNELLKFMTTTTSNIQEALGRSTKTKKVNHRKYLEKRLQNRGPRQVKNEKKSKLTTTTSNAVLYSNRQPVAGLLPAAAPTASQQQSRIVSSFVKQSQLPNEYDQLYSIVSSPPLFPANNSPSSSHGDVAATAACCDPEIESLLSEFGVESPSQCSLYSETHSRATSSSRGSLVGSMCGSSRTSPLQGADPSTMVTMTTGGTDWYAYSPPSDFSDFEDSSPPNSSPAAAQQYYPTPVVSPSPPMSYYQQNLVASYDCIPSAGAVTTLTDPLVIDSRPGLSLPYSNPSITELIAELVSTP